MWHGVRKSSQPAPAQPLPGPASRPALSLPRRPLRSAFQVLGSFGFVLVGVVLIAQGSLWSILIGSLAVVVFGFFGIVGIRLLARPALAVDDAGIHDSTSGLSIGFIPWEQALGFRPTSYTVASVTNDLVAVVWADERWPWAHVGRLALRSNQANRSLGVPPAPLSADLLKVDGPTLTLVLLEQRRLRRPELPEAPGMPPTAPLA